MGKIILTIILISTIALGDDGWWIYTYEDTSTLKAVFNYLAIMKKESGYLSIINTILIAGLTFTIIFKFLDIMAIPKYLLSVIGTMLVVFSLNTTVMILNVKSYDSLNPNAHANNYATVDNVPFIFAVLSSAFSNVSYNTALLIETIFSTVDGSNITEASFLKTGNLGAWKILDALDSIDALVIDENGKNFDQAMREYLHKCIFDIGYAVDRHLRTEIYTTPNLFEYLDPAGSPNDAVRRIGNQRVYSSDGVVTCSSLYVKAKVHLNSLGDSNVLYEQANKILSRLTSNADEAGSAVTKMMTNSDLATSQANINNYILLNGVRKAFQSSWQSYGVGVSNAQAGFGAGLAEANLQAQGKIKAKSAATMMPSIHSVLQAVMYVLFPLVLVIQLFAGGFSILKNYILGILWIELWIPSYSVLNYFTLKEAQSGAYDKLISTASSSGPEGMLTLANQNEVYNTIANQAAIAADMYIVGVPALAGFILFASFQALAGITSGVANVIGVNANNQVLNQQRAEISSLDYMNEQMKLNNPMYTGNIGNMQAYVMQEAELSRASKAAGAFLASGATLDNFGKLANAKMFSSAEGTTKDVTRHEQLTYGKTMTQGLGVANDLATINAAEESMRKNIINKQTNAVDLGAINLYDAAQNLENFKTNVVSGATNDGVEVKQVINGLKETTEATPNGVLKQYHNPNGDVVKRNLDGSDKTDLSTVTDVSTTYNANNTNTANNVYERTNKTNLDNTFSAVNTREYTDKNGEHAKEYLNADGKAVGRTVTKYTDKGYSVEDQILNSEGKWENIRTNLDGSNITNKDITDTANTTYTRMNETNTSTKNINDKITSSVISHDTSITRKDNFTLEAKNEWNAFNIHQRINGENAFDTYRLTMDNISAGSAAKNILSNLPGSVTDIYSMGKAYYTNSNLEPNNNQYLQKRTDNFFNFGKEDK